MSRLLIFAAVAVLPALAAAPGCAEDIIRNPGVNSFYFPHTDFLNGGKPTPAQKLASDPAAMMAYAARESGIDSRTTSATSLSQYRQSLALAHSKRKHRPAE